MFYEKAELSIRLYSGGFVDFENCDVAVGKNKIAVRDRQPAYNDVAITVYYVDKVISYTVADFEEMEYKNYSVYKPEESLMDL